MVKYEQFFKMRENFKLSERSLALFFCTLIALSSLWRDEQSYVVSMAVHLYVIAFLMFLWLNKFSKDPAFFSSKINWLIVIFWIIGGISIFLSPFHFISFYCYGLILICVGVYYISLEVHNLQEGKKERFFLYFIFFLVFVAGTEASIAILDYCSSTELNFYHIGLLSALFPFCLLGAISSSNLNFPCLFRLIASLVSILVFLDLMLLATKVIFLCLLAFFLLLFQKYRHKAIGLTILLALLIMWIPSPLRNGLNFDNLRKSCEEKMNGWKASIEIIKDKPQGVGLGMYRYYYPRYSKPGQNVKIARLEKMNISAPNIGEIFQLACELSVFSIFIFFGVIVFILTKVFLKVLISKKGAELKLAFSASLFTIFLNNFFSPSLNQLPIAMLFVINIGFCEVLISSDEDWIKRTSLQIRHPRFIQILIFALGTALASFFVFEHLIFGFSLKYMGIEDPEQRLKKLIKLSRIPSGYSPLYLEIGRELKTAFLKSSEPKLLNDAMDYFDLSARLNREDYQPFFELSESLFYLWMSSGEQRLAELSLHFGKLSLKRNPNYPFSYYVIAQSLNALGKDEEAIKNLKMALSLEPYYFKARALLVKENLKLGNYETAREEYQLLRSQFEEVKRELERKPGSFSSPYQVRLLEFSPLAIKALEQEVMKGGKGL